MASAKEEQEKRAEHYVKTYDIWSLAKMLVEYEDRLERETAKVRRLRRPKPKPKTWGDGP
jgi:hypothetical protein